MTRAIIALLLIFGHVPLAAAPRRGAVQPPPPPVAPAADQRVIVLLDRPQGAGIHMPHATTAIIDRNAPRIYAKWRVVPGFAATVDDTELERLRNDPDVISVEPDLGGSVTRLVTPLSNGESIGLSGQIGLNGELIGLSAVHALGYDGTGSTVAVLGTGVSQHPDLKGRIIEERCYCAYVNGKGCCPNGATEHFGSGSARDDLPHETGVAGVIAGSGGIAPRGIAPGANIVAIRLSDGTGNVAWTSQVISALDWIAASPLRVDAVNMSFAIGFLSKFACDEHNPALADAIARVRARGIVVVAASGNDAVTQAIRPPACISGVVSVGAVYHTNLASASLLGCTDTPAEVDRVTCFSNSAAQLDLLAPGYRVPTAYKTGGVASASGTSFSAPHVAGAVALLRQIDPNLTPDAIEELLESTGRPIVDSRNGVVTPRLDLFSAVMKLRLNGTPQGRRRAVRH
ncbi:MAG TPA: S8 family serine peptidase [Thermoanaerobaculia bacterium]|nr:S8 family serine peptidase [Thermoanaerobaculia bacterium]